MSSEMKFTKDFINWHREHLKANKGLYVWNEELASAALDEIERLQEENRVHSTEDNDFPLKGEEVIFQCKARPRVLTKAHIGYFTYFEDENVFISSTGYSFYPANETIFWKLFNNLEGQHQSEQEQD